MGGRGVIFPGSHRFWQASLILALVGFALAGTGLGFWLLASPLRRQQRHALQSLV